MPVLRRPAQHRGAQRGAPPEALSLNLLVTLVVPLAAGVWLRRMVFALRGQVVDQPRVGERGFAVVCVVSLAFAVVRNTPYGAWLAP